MPESHPDNYSTLVLVESKARRAENCHLSLPDRPENDQAAITVNALNSLLLLDDHDNESKVARPRYDVSTPPPSPILKGQRVWR